MTPAVEETNIAPPLPKGFTGMVRNLARSAMLSKKAERQARQRAGVLAVRRRENFSLLSWLAGALVIY